MKKVILLSLLAVQNFSYGMNSTVQKEQSFSSATVIPVSESLVRKIEKKRIFKSKKPTAVFMHISPVTKSQDTSENKTDWEKVCTVIYKDISKKIAQEKQQRRIKILTILKKEQHRKKDIDKNYKSNSIDWLEVSEQIDRKIEQEKQQRRINTLFIIRKLQDREEKREFYKNHFESI